MNSRKRTACFRTERVGIHKHANEEEAQAACGDGQAPHHHPAPRRQKPCGEIINPSTIEGHLIPQTFYRLACLFSFFLSPPWLLLLLRMPVKLPDVLNLQTRYLPNSGRQGSKRTNVAASSPPLRMITWCPRQYTGTITFCPPP